MAGADWIGLVERAYSLEGTEQEWLRGVVEAAVPLLDHGFGAVGWTFEWGERRPTEIAAADRRLMPHPRLATGARLGLSVFVRDEHLELLHGRRSAFATFSDLAGSTRAVAELPYWRRGWITRRVASHLGWAASVCNGDDECGSLEGVRDIASALSITPRGPGVVLAGPRPREEHASPRDVARWTHATVHIAAGLRLRRRSRALARRFDGEAVLTLDGRLHHAEGEAEDAGLQDALRRATVAIDRARGAARREDPDGALQMWRGLVQGRWSLIDRFDRDGRHYVVARRNEPSVVDPRALTEGERAVLGYAAMGWSSKHIAYALGVGPSTVTTQLSRAMWKLGLKRVDLPLIAEAPAEGARHFDIDAEHGVAATSIEAPDTSPPELSESEREVALLAIGGLSNDDIARRRRTATRTIANQLASVYRKLRVGSRAELASLLRRGRASG